MSPVELEQRIAEHVRDIPDYPKPGVVFKDITPLLADAATFATVVEALAAPFTTGAESGSEGTLAVPDVVVGIEARGFILAAPVAHALGAGFVPIRKQGKLPARTLSATYDLEYGSETMEMHADAFAPGARVLIVDDVLATGGTAAAAMDLVAKAGGTVHGLSFLLELGFLSGREQVPTARPHVLMTV
ncbi:adenine phosphoribosyltransferase [Lipingzhangella sp. LS1_29]|uniref:Adenine phosphoribosyltransferase n=1 Tax=Lipingzhangella rawalii TaxID=2055835 RepID=A0ABU2H7P6_9ACTN|nr:adenine phosphoribosyltransferase [Lipingzhangella rawalii]MDS1271326.1 adenine phosphoribosyltransferase [Lipingzhangella rawalii]